MMGKGGNRGESVGYWGNSGEFEGDGGGKFERFVNGINF